MKSVSSIIRGEFGGRSGRIEFHTYDPEHHLNIVNYNYVGTRSEVCTSPEMARKLRDELNRIYPLSTSEKRKSPNGAQAYRGNGKHGWETVTGGTERLRVPGGWLYRTTATKLNVIGKEDVSVTTAFVPVPEVVGYAV